MGCQAGVSHYTVQSLRERFGELERKAVPAHNSPPSCSSLLPVVKMGVPFPGCLAAHAWPALATSQHAAASLAPLPSQSCPWVCGPPAGCACGAAGGGTRCAR